MMESIVLSGQGLKNLDIIDIELKNKSKTAVHIDLSHNYLTDFNTRFNFLSLQILILDSNQLTTIKNFPIIKNLDTLSINDNNFASPLELAMYCLEKVSYFVILFKFPQLKLINTLRNPMNPGLENLDDYLNYRAILQKVKTLQLLDGINIYDKESLLAYSKGDLLKSRSPNLFSTGNLDSITEENDENELYNIIKQKKRQSTITYSQKMLKKADNLTKFNRKNHSEGNKHIKNNDL